jgi:putative oxidoreductase
MESFRHAQAESTGRFFLRLAVGGLMLFHGVAKLWTGVGWIAAMLTDMGLPDWIAYGVYGAEIAAPILILLGVLIRTAALAIAFDMMMAILLVLRPTFFSLKPSGGGWSIELEVFFLLASLSLAFLGAGDFRLFFLKRKPK